MCATNHSFNDEPEPLFQYRVYGMFLDIRTKKNPGNHCTLQLWLRHSPHSATLCSFLFIALLKLPSRSVDVKKVFILGLSQYSVRHEQNESTVCVFSFYSVFYIYHNINPVLAVCH